MANPLDHLVAQRAPENGSPRGHGADVLDESVSAHLLEHIAGGARKHGGVDGFVIVVGGQDDAADLRILGAHVATHIDAVAVWQPHVHEHDIRIGRGDARPRLGSGARLPHDLDVWLRLAEVDDPSSHDLLVVNDKHPHGAAPSFCCSSRSSIGTDHTRLVRPFSESKAKVPPRSTARCSRFASPLRRLTPVAPAPSSVTSRVTRSSVTVIASDTCCAAACFTTLVRASRATATISSASESVMTRSTGPENSICGPGGSASASSRTRSMIRFRTVRVSPCAREMAKITVRMCAIVESSVSIERV